MSINKILAIIVIVVIAIVALKVGSAVIGTTAAQAQSISTPSLTATITGTAR